MHLVKYVPPSRLTFLSDLLLRVTQPSDLNDPFDLAPHVSRLVPLRGAQQTALLIGAVTSTSRPLEQHRRLRFSDLAPYRYDPHRELEAMQNAPALNAAFGRMVGDRVRDLVLNRIGVFSACDTASSPLMWSMYADTHRGFAIELDAARQLFEQVCAPRPPFGTFRRVAYVQNRPSVSALELMAPPDNWSASLSRRVLFTKSASSREEREWRIALPLDDQEQYPHEVQGRIHLFSVCAAAVRRVIVGARCAPDVAKQIFALVRRSRRMRHVEVIQAQLRHDSYRVRLVPYRKRAA